MKELSAVRVVFEAPNPVLLENVSPDGFRSAYDSLIALNGEKYTEDDTASSSVVVNADQIFDASTNKKIGCLDDPCLMSLNGVLRASREWLFADKPVSINAWDNFEPEQGYVQAPNGGWHSDWRPGEDTFRGVLIYDGHPTEFAVGKAELHIAEEALSSLFFPAALKRAIYKSEGDTLNQLTRVDGPDPYRLVGIDGDHWHRARGFDETDEVRRIIRMSTIRSVGLDRHDEYA